jgi:hypothetical protein
VRTRTALVLVLQQERQMMMEKAKSAINWWSRCTYMYTVVEWIILLKCSCCRALFQLFCENTILGIVYYGALLISGACWIWIWVSTPSRYHAARYNLPPKYHLVSSILTCSCKAQCMADVLVLPLAIKRAALSVPRLTPPAPQAAVCPCSSSPAQYTTQAVDPVAVRSGHEHAELRE